MTYSVISGHSLDPIEKKPLFHFFPGSRILSVGSYGCNMRCDFCQNWHISQARTGSIAAETGPEELASEAGSFKNNAGIAFTYNEPVIWFEFVRDTALIVKGKGLFTVMVSNGFVNSDPLNEFLGFIDAFNIDLKAFNETFYKRLTGAELEPVKKSLKQIAKAGKHLEITTLVIPGKNDSVADMEAESKWIAEELGDEIPLHLSRYFPMYKSNEPATPTETLDNLYDTARRYLKYVYLGNTVSDNRQDTACSGCGTIVTKRSGYDTKIMNLDISGKCAGCGNQIYRYLTLPSGAGR